MSTTAERLKAYANDPEFQFDLVTIEVGELIVDRLEALDLSQKQLAERLGVSAARVSQILKGNDNLTLKSLVAVAVALGVRLSVGFDLDTAVAHDARDEALGRAS